MTHVPHHFYARGKLHSKSFSMKLKLATSPLEEHSNPPLCAFEFQRLLMVSHDTVNPLGKYCI